MASCHDKMVVGTLVLLLISVRMFQNSSEVPVAGWLKSDLPKVSSCLCKPSISHRWERAGNVYTASDFFMSSGDPNTSHQDCLASTLPTTTVPADLVSGVELA